MSEWFVREWTRGGMAGVVKVLVVGLALLSAPVIAWAILVTLWRLVRYGPRATFGGEGADAWQVYLAAIVILCGVVALLFTWSLRSYHYW